MSATRVTLGTLEQAILLACLAQRRRPSTPPQEDPAC
jgi:hypothetical protein